MDFSVDEHRFVLAKSLAMLRKSARQLQQIDDSSFPTDSSDTARQLLLAAFEALGRPEHVSLMSPAVLYNRLHELLRLIDMVERSTTDRISWPLVSYCDAIWSELFHDNGPGIFYSVTPDHNYNITRFTGLLSLHLEDLLPESVSSQLTDGKAIYCLELASAEDDNLPLYANIGHEFGHAVFDNKRREIIQALSDRASGLSNAVFSQLSKLDPRSARRVFDRVGPAIIGLGKELFCDLVGARLMGPAFHLSLYEIAWGHDSKSTFSISLSPDDNSIKGYPSMNFRLARIRDKARIQEFCIDGRKSVQADHIDHLSDLFDLLDSLPTKHDSDFVQVRPLTDPDAETVRNVLTDNLELVKTCLTEFLDDCEAMLYEWYPKLSGPTVRASDVSALLSRLDKNLPPNVVPNDDLLGKRASFPAILNAAAMYRMRALSSANVDEQNDLARQVDLVERLTAKSFEVSFIHGQYMDWRVSNNERT